MSSRLRPITRRDLIKRLRRLGWEGPRHANNHDYMFKGKRKVHIPNQHRSDISVGLLHLILKQAEITNKEWFDIN